MAQYPPQTQIQLETLGLLTGGVAHDFNNILTSIIGQTDMALIKLPPDDDARPHIENAAKAAEFASRLTRQLLILARGERLAAEPFRLNTFIEENEILMRMLLPSGASLKLVLSKSDPIILAKQLDIQRVLLNLIINAAEALPEKYGRIVVRTRTSGAPRHNRTKNSSSNGRFPHGFVLLQVEDNGAGMNDDTMAKIFDPFFTTKSAGKGMGLTMVQQIVANCNGGITVDSQPNKGTTFTIFLPHHSAKTPVN